MSGFFQGYAQMMSSVGWRRDNVWSQGNARNNPWGRSFKVKWLQLSDLPFQKTLHLKNPLNDYKPVKISRDCQVPSSYDDHVLEIFHRIALIVRRLTFLGVTPGDRRSSLWAAWWEFWYRRTWKVPLWNPFSLLRSSGFWFRILVPLLLAFNNLNLQGSVYFAGGFMLLPRRGV